MRLNATVRRLQRTAEGFWNVATDGAPLARYAGPAFDCDDGFDRGEALRDESLGLGVCGDWLGGGGGVEVARHAGDELADPMAASFERADVAPELAWAVS